MCPTPIYSPPPPVHTAAATVAHCGSGNPPFPQGNTAAEVAQGGSGDSPVHSTGPEESNEHCCERRLFVFRSGLRCTECEDVEP